MKSFKSLGVCDELIQALQKQGIKSQLQFKNKPFLLYLKGMML